MDSSLASEANPLTSGIFIEGILNQYFRPKLFMLIDSKPMQQRYIT
jgi:hypothetical protein